MNPKNSNIISIVLTILVFGLLAFTKSDNSEQLLRHFNKNIASFEKTAIKDVYEYKSCFYPTELKLVQLNRRSQMSKEELKEYREIQKGGLDFLLKLSIANNGSKDLLKYDEGKGFTYEQKLLYYSFEFQNDIKLVLDNTDTLYCLDYQFERGYDISPTGTLSLGFNTNKKFKQMKLIANDRCFAGQKMEFNYTPEDIKVISKLKKYK